MKHTIPRKPILSLNFTFLNCLVRYAEALVPHRSAYYMLCVIDLDVLWFIYYFVFAGLFIFFLYHYEHWALSLLEVCFATDLEVLWLAHNLGQKGTFGHIETIHLFLQSLFPDMRSDLQSEMVYFRYHEGWWPIIMFHKVEISLLWQTVVKALTWNLGEFALYSLALFVNKIFEVLACQFFVKELDM